MRAMQPEIQLDLCKPMRHGSQHLCQPYSPNADTCGAIQVDKAVNAGQNPQPPEHTAAGGQGRGMPRTGHARGVCVCGRTPLGWTRDDLQKVAVPFSCALRRAGPLPGAIVASRLGGHARTVGRPDDRIDNA
eukprot:11796303-Alexandrium_andersonii.AAC.1